MILARKLFKLCAVSVLSIPSTLWRAATSARFIERPDNVLSKVQRSDGYYYYSK